MQKRSSDSVRIFYPRFSKEEIISDIHRKLTDLNKKLPLRLVILFGSYATGKSTVASDVDILVVYRGERRQDSYAVVKRTLDISRLEPHIYTEEEYEEMKEIVDKMTKSGIVLFQKEKRGISQPAT